MPLGAALLVSTPARGANLAALFVQQRGVLFSVYLCASCGIFVVRDEKPLGLRSDHAFDGSPVAQVVVFSKQSRDFIEEFFVRHACLSGVENAEHAL